MSISRLFVLLSITIWGASHGSNTYADVAAGKSVENDSSHELYKIDSTLKQLGVEYQNATKAISVNDADKVYLERFADDLEKQRREACKDLQLEPTCYR